MEDRTIKNEMLADAGVTAAEKGWTILALTLEDGGEGTLPGGAALIRRKRHPFEGKPYAILSLIINTEGDGEASFAAGSYDLDAERARIEYEARARRFLPRGGGDG